MKTHTKTAFAVAAVITFLTLGCDLDIQTDPEVAPANTKTDAERDPPPVTLAPDVEAELAKLEGKWNGVSFNVDGLVLPPTQWYRYSFRGDQMTTETSEGSPASVKFHLDPHTDPKQLDTSNTVDGVEEISKGIYSIDGDILQLSWRVGGERPTNFHSTDGDEKVVIVLRRAND